ncbi:MAG: SRPBCC family protein [Arenicella sp.]
MSEPTLNVQSDQLSLKQIFEAPISRLFTYFTEPEFLSQWHAPSDTMTTTAEVNLQVGGSYRIAMTDADGKTHTAIGQFIEINKPTKLVYSWAWEGNDSMDTLVTVNFKEVGEQTEVELVHTGFDQAEAAQHHSQGWSGIFMQLEQFLKN